MKKDIRIPVSENIHVAIIHEWNEEFQCNDWNAYLINNSDSAVEMVFVSTHGYAETVKTSTMRHGLGTISAKSHAKIELLHEDVLKLNNEFFVSYFGQRDGKLYEKKFLFRKNTINERAMRDIPVMNCKGILA
ncbi:hypothetical protein MQE36_06340 [Zhouia spongiae]|uniref:Phenylalanyl-tRNA synthetase subunit alpha n=1 Tax=Zhouia spongiae TaxID=2202721 RepID=A0ABY3YTJ6_9FLAO|nr:hypothetical protein [Zhouia spongiae]UNY99963.1 hypothetical protein MQE36_06340 [Zhouia spongiae]